MNTELQLDAASGYLYLGMPDECLNELDQVKFLDHRSERYLVLRLTAMIIKRQWMEALIAARHLKFRYADCELAYIAGSISLIEMKRYSEAIVFILQGPLSLRYKAIMHLQIAYCEVQLGHDQAAELSLRSAHQLDPELTMEALHDVVTEHVNELTFSN